MRPRLFFVFCLFIFFCCIASLVSAEPTNITACSPSIYLPGQYTLNQSISSSTSCLIINSSNVEVDCQGYTITYNSGGGNTQYGINIIYLLTPLSNITVKNCIIQDNNNAGTPVYGIQMTRVTDSFITNNTY